MSTEQDKQSEPVDKASDDQYMDTGVLHEPKPKAKGGVKGAHPRLVELDEAMDLEK